MVYVSRPRLGDVCNVLAMAQPDRLTRQFRYGIQLAGAAWPQFLRPLVLELVSHRTVTPSAMIPPRRSPGYQVEQLAHRAAGPRIPPPSIERILTSSLAGTGREDTTRRHRRPADQR